MKAIQNISDSTRQKLASFAQTAQYEAVCDVLEAECDRAEAELLAANIANEKEVIAKHNRAQAFRQLFERFQKTVDEIRASQYQPPPDITPDELARRIVRNPGEYL